MAWLQLLFAACSTSLMVSLGHASVLRGSERSNVRTKIFGSQEGTSPCRKFASERCDGANCDEAAPCGDAELKSEGMLVSTPECSCNVEGENCFCSAGCSETRKEEVCSELIGPCRCSRSTHAYCECQGYCHTIENRIDACHSVQGCAWHGSFCDIVQRFKYDPVSGQLGPDFADEEWFNKYRRDLGNTTTAEKDAAAEAVANVDDDVEI